MSRKVDPRTSSGKILRGKKRYPESFRVLCLCCLVGSTGADDGDDNDCDGIHGDIYKIMFVVFVIFCWCFVFLIL